MMKRMEDETRERHVRQRPLLISKLAHTHTHRMAHATQGCRGNIGMPSNPPPLPLYSSLPPTSSPLFSSLGLVLIPLSVWASIFARPNLPLPVLLSSRSLSLSLALQSVVNSYHLTPKHQNLLVLMTFLGESGAASGGIFFGDE